MGGGGLGGEGRYVGRSVSTYPMDVQQQQQQQQQEEGGYLKLGSPICDHFCLGL